MIEYKVGDRVKVVDTRDGFYTDLQGKEFDVIEGPKSGYTGGYTVRLSEPGAIQRWVGHWRLELVKSRDNDRREIVDESVVINFNGDGEDFECKESEVPALRRLLDHLSNEGIDPSYGTYKFYKEL